MPRRGAPVLAMAAACLTAVAVVASFSSGTVTTVMGSGAGGSAGLVGPLTRYTPLPTRTRPPAPGAGQLEAQEGPKGLVGPRRLGSAAAPVAYTYKVRHTQAPAFARVTGAPASAASAVVYIRAYHGTTAVADLAVYRFKPSVALPDAFQAQVVTQLVRQASGASVVGPERLGGRPLAYAGGAQPAAAWFGNSLAVLVLGPVSGAAGLATARAVVYGYAFAPQG